jgi:CRP/FNR family transcriptional regulator
VTRSKAEIAAHAAALSKVSFFRLLDDHTLMELSRATRVLAFEKDGELFAEGEPCRGMFLILKGSVKVFRSALSGREQILTIESAGSVVAELPLFDGEPYPATCAALEPTETLLVPRSAFEESLTRRPDLALGVIRVLGERLRYLVTLVDEVSLMEIPQRLAKYLLGLAEEHGAVFTLTLSNQEIAGRIGTVRELVSRNLHRLADQGAIEIKGREIKIVDEDSLRDLVNES